MAPASARSSRRRAGSRARSRRRGRRRARRQPAAGLESETCTRSSSGLPTGPRRPTWISTSRKASTRIVRPLVASPALSPPPTPAPAQTLGSLVTGLAGPGLHERCEVDHASVRPRPRRSARAASGSRGSGTRRCAERAGPQARQHAGIGRRLGQFGRRGALGGHAVDRRVDLERGGLGRRIVGGGPRRPREPAPRPAAAQGSARTSAVHRASYSQRGLEVAVRGGGGAVPCAGHDDVLAVATGAQAALLTAAAVGAAAVLRPARSAGPCRRHARLAVLAVGAIAALKRHTISNGISGHGALALVAAVVGLAGLGLLTEIIRRRPQAFALLAFVALPFRVPVTSAREREPAAPAVRRDRRRGAGVRPAPVAGAGRARTAGTPGARRCGAWRSRWRSCSSSTPSQSAYSSDITQATPRLLLLRAVRGPLPAAARRPWTTRLLRRSSASRSALALLFAAVGFVEAATAGC